jgi:hypothetical protein
MFKYEKYFLHMMCYVCAIILVSIFSAFISRNRYLAENYKNACKVYIVHI